jgi:hypothetical protein
VVAWAVVRMDFDNLPTPEMSTVGVQAAAMLMDW